jgi:hypothetical protein
MSKGYKKEWIDKVKSKFNDVQPANKKDNNAAAKQCNNKERKERNASGVVRI